MTAFAPLWRGKLLCPIAILRTLLFGLDPFLVKAEGFATLEEFKATWTKINGAWNPDQQVTAYEFHKVEKTKEQNTLRSYLANRDDTKTEKQQETN